MGRSLTPEEKQLRKWLRDTELIRVIVCRKCGRKHEIIKRYEWLSCSCQTNIIFGMSINYKNCEVLFDRDRLEEESK